MNPLMLQWIGIIWHNLRRFAGVVLIGVVLIGTPYLVYQKAYTKGYNAGYAKAVSDRPTYSNVGTVINQPPAQPKDEFKILGVRVNIWKLHLNLGI